MCTKRLLSIVALLGIFALSCAEQTATCDTYVDDLYAQIKIARQQVILAGSTAEAFDSMSLSQDEAVSVCKQEVEPNCSPSEIAKIQHNKVDAVSDTCQKAIIQFGMKVFGRNPSST